MVNSLDSNNLSGGAVDGKGQLIGEYSYVTNVQSGEDLQIVIESRSDTNLRKEALVSMQFRAADGTPISNPEWPYISEKVGEFKYLDIAPPGEYSTTIIPLTVPDKAESLELKGVQWKSGAKTWLVGSPAIIRLEGKFSVFYSPSGRPLENSTASLRLRHQLSNEAGAVRLSMAVRSGDSHGKAPVSIDFFDKAGEEVLGVGDLPQNPNFGSFVNVEPPTEGEASQEWVFEVPDGSHFLELRGIDWGEKSAIVVGEPVISEIPTMEASLYSFVEQTDAVDSIVVLDTTAPPVGHETLALRPNNLAKEYAKLGSLVIYFPFGSIQEQPEVVEGRIFQTDRKNFDRVFSALGALTLDIPKIYVCSSFPNLESCAMATWLKAKGWLIVYECRDDMEEFNRVGYSKWYNVQLERQMLRLADKVVSVSPALDEKLLSLSGQIENHIVIPNGVNPTVIEEAEPLRRPEILPMRNRSRTLGYVGHLTESWFDWPLLIAAAKTLPDIEFEIIGHGMPKNMELPANVRYLGPKTHAEVRAYAEKWKAGLIPFKDLPLTRSVDPNKIYEYQAWGLRTLSAPMGMVEEYPSAWVYRGVDEFVRHAVEIVEEDIDIEELETLDRFVKGCSWTRRARTMRSEFGIEV